METSKLKLADFEVYKENPSKPEGIVSRNIIEQDGARAFVDKETGEEKLYFSAGTHKIVEHDGAVYIKVYHPTFSIIKDFNSSEIKVWCFISTILKPKKDEITLNISDCKDYTGYSSDVNIYKGILGLLEKKFIYRKTGSGNYFIDVNMFFNGRRI